MFTVLSSYKKVATIRIVYINMMFTRFCMWLASPLCVCVYLMYLMLFVIDNARVYFVRKYFPLCSRFDRGRQTNLYTHRYIIIIIILWFIFRLEARANVLLLTSQVIVSDADARILAIRMP